MPGLKTIAPLLLALGLLGTVAPSPAPAGPDEAESMLPDARLGTRVAPLLLLGRPDVRANLSLSAEQSAAARHVIAELYRRAMESRAFSGAEALTARRAIDDAQRRWIEGELTDKQQARLDQLDLQWEGPSALVTRPAIADALAIDGGQREVLRRAVERRDALRKAHGHRPADDHNLAREALAVLSAEQRDRWLAMLGAPLFGPRTADAPPPPVVR